MFWRVSNFTTSAVEAILDRPDFSLEDLLEEDELIQECKALNERLVHFLKRPETVAKLLEYITQPVPATAEEKRQFRYPYLSCEVLCCEIDGVFSTLLSSEQLLEALFSLLHQPQPLECLLAGYFARVLVCVLMKRAQSLLGYLRANQQHLSRMVAHMDNTSVAEALAHVVGADEMSAGLMRPEDLAWLQETSVLQELLDTLGHEDSKPAWENAAIVLSAIARSHTCPLTHALGSAHFLNQLLSRAVISGGSGADVAQALDVPIALLERRSTLEAAHAHFPNERAPTEADVLVETETATIVASYAEQLAAIMEPAADEAPQLTPFGRLSPPLGLARVKVAELFAALLGVGSDEAGEAVITAGVLEKSLSLVRRYPFNNILHAQATRMLLATLEYGNEELVNHLFRNCELITWLISAPASIPAQPRGGIGYMTSSPSDAADTSQAARTEGAPQPTSSAERAQSAASEASASQTASPTQVAASSTSQRPPLRAGYLGHMTLIANRMEAAATRRHVVHSFLAASSDWQKYSAGPLQEHNAVEDPSAWGCGRPDLQALQAAASIDKSDANLAAAFPDEQPAGGSPVSGQLSRYSGDGEAFGDVEEDEGASGNPGTATLGSSDGGGVDSVLSCASSRASLWRNCWSSF